MAKRKKKSLTVEANLEAAKRLRDEWQRKLVKAARMIVKYDGEIRYYSRIQERTNDVLRKIGAQQ